MVKGATHAKWAYCQEEENWADRDKIHKWHWDVVSHQQLRDESYIVYQAKHALWHFHITVTERWGHREAPCLSILLLPRSMRPWQRRSSLKTTSRHNTTTDTNAWGHVNEYNRGSGHNWALKLRKQSCKAHAGKLQVITHYTLHLLT